MHRIEVCLEEDAYRFLQAQAERQGKALGELLREVAEVHIRTAKLNDPLWSIVGMVEGEASAVAREHDRYLYGDPL